MRSALAFLSIGVVLALESTACVCVGCGNAPRPQIDPKNELSPDPQAAPIDVMPDEKWFTSDDGWKFLAPKDYVRNTSPGTTGFAVSKPPPPKLPIAIVLTTEPFDESVTAFVAKERAKVEIVKEDPNGFGVVVEESWPIGDGERGKALVLLAVDRGVGVRLSCIGSGATFDNQRSICTRAVESLRRAR